MKHLILAGFAALCTLSPALAQHSHGNAQAAPGIAVTDGFARATLPGAPVGGAYLTLHNGGTEDDRLVSVSSPAAGRMAIHDMVMEGDTMKMTPLPDGLPLPAGETVTLEPSGKHLMLMDLTGPLTEGETLDVTLTFERADPVTVQLPIAAVNAGGDAGGHGHHHGHGH